MSTTLLRWLHRAIEEHRVWREGQGTRNDPHRYQLPTVEKPFQDIAEVEPLRVG